MEAAYRQRDTQPADFESALQYSNECFAHLRLAEQPVLKIGTPETVRLRSQDRRLISFNLEIRMAAAFSNSSANWP